MGTQFWWFYDVLLLCVTGGILYGAVSRGFNKGIFRLIGCILAIIAGIFVSDLLKEAVYESLFQQKITDSVSAALDNEEWDVFEKAAENAALSTFGEDEIPDADAFRKAHTDMQNEKAEQYPEWFVSSVCGVTEYVISAAQKPHAGQSLASVFENDHSGLCTLLEQIGSGDAQEAAVMLEEQFYRPVYVRMIRMALFLLIVFVILIVCGIISSMAGNLEQQMHIRKGDHALGILVGISETAVFLLFVIAAVRLTVLLTDGQMLLFNTQTIEQTKLFRYLYYL